VDPPLPGVISYLLPEMEGAFLLLATPEIKQVTPDSFLLDADFLD
jgi:hypothetical protein